jgi:hypothetical protein
MTAPLICWVPQQLDVQQPWSGQPQRAQLLDHSDGLLACRHDVHARVDRLERPRNGMIVLSAATGGSKQQARGRAGAIRILAVAP